MALITNSNAFDTPFTPAAGDFFAQVTKGAAQLECAGVDLGASTAWTPVRGGVLANEAVYVHNAVAGTVYRWVPFTKTTATTIGCYQ